MNLLNNRPAGIFTTLLITEDSFYHLSTAIAVEYYLSRSGDKSLSPLYTNVLQLKQNDFDTTNSFLGQVIRNKYIDKWKRIYEALVVSNYDVLTDYKIDKNVIGKDTDNKSYTTNNTLTDDINSTITYNTTLKSNGTNINTETTDMTDTDNNDVYGFNSVSPVGDSVSTSVNSTSVKGNDTNDSTSIKTGTDTKGDKKTTLDTKNENENKTLDTSRNTTISGRHKSNAELLEQELQLRNDNIFINIVLDDIDKEMTLDIYERGVY